MLINKTPMWHIPKMAHTNRRSSRIAAATSVVPGIALTAALAIGLGLRGLSQNIAASRYIADGIAEGDRITVNGTSGMVEQIGHAMTTLRGDDGRIFLVPNHHFVEHVVVKEPRETEMCEYTPTVFRAPPSYPVCLSASRYSRYTICIAAVARRRCGAKRGCIDAAVVALLTDEGWWRCAMSCRMA